MVSWRTLNISIERYGSDPAFFLSTATSRYSPGNQPKPMFFMWDSSERDTGNPVQTDYWRNAVDAIHALPQGGLMIADMQESRWITGQSLRWLV